MMKVVDLFIIISTFLILRGIWQFFWIRITLKGYELQHETDESFFDFCMRYYNTDFRWRLRKLLGIRWFYNSKLFPKITRLKGVIQVLFGVAILIAVFLFKDTEYGVFLNIKI